MCIKKAHNIHLWIECTAKVFKSCRFHCFFSNNFFSLFHFLLFLSTLCVLSEWNDWLNIDILVDQLRYGYFLCKSFFFSKNYFKLDSMNKKHKWEAHKRKKLIPHRCTKTDTLELNISIECMLRVLSKFDCNIAHSTFHILHVKEWTFYQSFELNRNGKRK